MLKKYVLIVFLFLFNIFFTFAYKVDLPNSTSDIIVSNTTVEVAEDSYKQISQKINDYLWFFMWAISLFVVVYAWFLLMSSNGSDEDKKKANKMLIWWLIWIFISLFAYTIVNLLITLF